MTNTFCESKPFKDKTIVKHIMNINEKRAPHIIYEVDKHNYIPTLFSTHNIPYDDWFKVTIVFLIDRHLIQGEYFKCIISKPYRNSFQLVYHKDSRKKYICDIYLYYDESKSELSMTLYNFKPRPRWYLHKIILNS